MNEFDSLIARLDRATADRRLLEHPFYRAWAEGTLKLSDLGFYSTQYWRQVESFPRYLTAVAERIEDPEARSIVRANLADEVDQDHPGLWLRFAEALGTPSERVATASPEAETARCVDSFTAAMNNDSVPFALGMLYGYESQTPTVAETKVRGLAQHYGIEGPAVRYFELHGVLDVEHSRDMARAISRCCADEEDLAEAERGAAAGAAAIWGLLDGVERVRNSV